MNTLSNTPGKMTHYRWVICAMLFFATTVNYLDRQVLSLTWKDFIAPEFHWTDAHYGDITAVFSIVYAIANLFAGRFIDWMGTKKGYLWAIFVWSLGACLHAACGWATEQAVGIHDAAAMISATGAVASTIAITSVYFFIAARIVLSVGEAGNFPAAIKVTAEYFPKKDRAFSTSIFNAGATVGALIAPVSIPPLARYFQRIGIGNGWEMAFIVIGALGFVWMGLWMFLYKKPNENPAVNAAELAYIEQDKLTEEDQPPQDGKPTGNSNGAPADGKAERKLSFVQCLKHRQAWAFAIGKFMTDGVWWFFLFWTPAYISDVYGFSSDSGTAQLLIFVLYAITMLSIYGGKLPTIIINKTGLNPYAARMRAMFIFALFPLLALFAQPLGAYSYWYPIIIIGIAGAAHQSWSANIYSVVGDMFPKSAVATITGLGGMAGGVGAFLINKGSGMLFTYADASRMTFMGFVGKPAGYFIIFCVCAVAYLIGWCIMKALVPKYKPIVAD
ncbi:ACS family hexuronate transporter-like MFS transporter [Bacteroides zoogleoformans]|uniref:MFS transporter n=1 Tax=Bacteroides zoogleoformans TaxID=28119 RepID=A0ABN5IHV2_9BACE|nr:MFS transporter [Bacteroides zoogleoformans]AVM52207.1 MFS transporter [Bacteroides zoogleoformans]TWJ16509.1 ACS family hexuronate transporter-like MFS transporter [Bacteroides zoogleoformans]